MVKKATLCVLAMLLVVGMFFNIPAKAQVATPTQAVITVSGVPTGTTSLAIPVTVDTSIVTIGSASSSVSGTLVVVGSMSEGIGIVSTTGDLPASFTVTAGLTGVAVGTSTVTLGAVADMIGGTAIAGATAVSDTSSVTVASSSSTTSSTSSSTGGGALTPDTFTIMITGEAIKQTSAVNVTVAFGDSSIATLNTAGITVTGTGVSQLLTDANATTNVISAVWSGTSTDGVVTITGMLLPGTMGGTTSFGVAKVEASGGTDITANVAIVVDPTSVTNGSGSSSSGVGTFTLVSPSSVTGPGSAAVAFSAVGAANGTTATLNGSNVEFRNNGTVGLSIVDLPDSGSLALTLVVMSGGTDTTVNLGNITVNAGTGDVTPKAKTAHVRNNKNNSKLVITGMGFATDETTVTIIPTDKTQVSQTVKKKLIKAKYAAANCIPKGSYVNVSTTGGTKGKKIKVTGTCSNQLVP